MAAAELLLAVSLVCLGTLGSHSHAETERERAPIMYHLTVVTLVALNRRFRVGSRAILSRVAQIVRFQGRFKHW